MANISALSPGQIISFDLNTTLISGGYRAVKLLANVEYSLAVQYTDVDSKHANIYDTLPDGTPRGYVLLTYDGMPIGFEKNIGNRANNLYPQEWRIKSSHVPDEAPAVLTQSV